MATKRYATVTVFRDLADQPAVQIPYHELPVLELVHGPGKVTVHEYFDKEIDEEKGETNFDPADEFERLVGKYGVHPDQKVPYVQQAYGVLTEGNLQKAINFKHQPADALNQALLPPAVQQANAAHAKEVARLQSTVAELKGRPTAADLAERDQKIAELEAQLKKGK